MKIHCPHIHNHGRQARMLGDQVRRQAQEFLPH